MPKSNQNPGKLPFFGTLFALTGLVFLFSIPLGTLPPLGSLLHPVKGILSSAEKGLASAINLEIEGLQEPVDVYYNERGVPHIFAQNDHEPRQKAKVGHRHNEILPWVIKYGQARRYA